MGYNICSLNLRRSIRGDDKDREFYAFINKLIKKEDIVIFAFQEAKNINFIRNLLRNLPDRWKGEYIHNSELSFVWDSYRVEDGSRSNISQELVIYKRQVKHFDRMSVPELSSNLNKKESVSHTPRVLYEFSEFFKYSDRVPVYGRFKPVDFKQNFEFRLINVHLYYGEDTPAANNIRMRECDAVKRGIYTSIDKPRKGKDGFFNNIFTVVLGDYNFDCATCNFYGLEYVRTFQEEKTTLKQPQEEYNNSEQGYSSSYDHFSYDESSSVPNIPPYRINAVKDYFDYSYQKYWDEVSNHVPVIIRLLR